MACIFAILYVKDLTHVIDSIMRDLVCLFDLSFLLLSLYSHELCEHAFVHQFLDIVAEISIGR